MSSISFQNVKNTLQNNFISLGCSSAAVNQLLTDDFVNGIIAICEQNQNQYNGEILASIEKFNNSPNLSNGKIFHDTFYIEVKKDGIVKDIIEYLNKNINLAEAPAPALLNLQNITENTSTSNTSGDVTIGKGAVVVLGALSIMALVAGGPAGFATFMLATVYVGGIFFEFDENGNLRYKEADYIKDIDHYLSTATDTRSPLIIDLDGDGVETLGTDSNVYFDHDGNGFAESTGWAGKDDGILIRDLNNNGQIDSGAELFGNNSVLSNGQKATNGFEALKDLDSNGDGKCDINDNAWNEVKVWKDTNQNGIADANELLSLEQAGVAGINLGYTNQNITDANGNQHSQTSTITKTDGSTATITDVWFDADYADTVDKTQVEIPDDIKLMPNLEGFGNVHSLQIAMALDTTGELKTLVQQYALETNAAARDAILINLIYHWAGVQNMDPEGRNPTQVYGNVLGDSRKLEALEEFLGEEYIGTWCWGEKDPNPHGQAAPLILKAFDELKGYVNTQLLAQTHYKSVLDSVTLTYNAETSSWVANVTDALASLREIYAQDMTTGLNAMQELGVIIGSFGNTGAVVIETIKAQGNIDGDFFDRELLNFGTANNNGSDGNDTLEGTDVADYLNGQAGNDRLFGNGGNDILAGGAGDDYLNGGNGADTYRFDVGFGNDTLDNSDDNASAETPDIIQFGEGIESARTTLERQGFDLIIKVAMEMTHCAVMMELMS